jgi:hypothetical protein
MARRLGEWPPLVAGGTNQAGTIMQCSFVLSSILAMILLIVVLVFHFERELNAAGSDVVMMYLVGLVIGFVILALWSRDYMRGRSWPLIHESAGAWIAETPGGG